MATISQNRAQVSWGKGAVAKDVQVKRLADTPENRARLQAEAKKDKTPSAIVDLGADVVLLSGRRLVTESRIAQTDVPQLKSGQKAMVGAEEGQALFTDDGFAEIDASNITVAVIDSGLDMDHPAFEGRVVKPYDVITGKSTLSDSSGHGTHVAGIVAGAWGLNKNAGGVARDAKIMPINVFSKAGRAEPAAIAKGIRYAVDNGAKVINMSLGGSEAQLKKLGLWEQLPELESAIRYAQSKGVVVVAASGNDGKNSISDYFPASYPGVLTVGAVNAGSKRTGFSNGGAELDLTAPGAVITSAVPGRGAQYDDKSGTSMASPYAAGAVALVMAQHPDWSAEQVVAHMKRAVNDRGVAGRDIEYGYGEVNLFKVAFGQDLAPISDTLPEKAPKRGFLDSLRAAFGL